MQHLTSVIAQQKVGLAVGIYAVCSAHPLVLKAALQQGLQDNSVVLIEATSNQVNQFGGYTGMQPAAFRDFVFSLADEIGVNRDTIILGGDHLGPNAWQKETAADAMEKACVMVHDYVMAGFRKIHLDCSMSCAGDPVPLADADVAQRAAQLCRVAEAAWQKIGAETEAEAPVYVIGTEVPVPGGAHEALDDLQVTSPAAAAQTLAVHRKIFLTQGCAAAWPRVIAMVVQPGVEFDHHHVIRYQAEKAAALSAFIADQTLVFEAHSTDYQTENALTELVRDHFAILKVGPGLTFALREALFALDAIESEWIDASEAAHLKKIVDQVMTDEPEYWQRYYSQTDSRADHQQTLDRHYSLSDRIRYYWPHPQIQAAQEKLFNNLLRSPPPLTLLSQYMPEQAKKVAQGLLNVTPEALVINKIMEVTQLYAKAVGRGTNHTASSVLRKPYNR